LRSQALLFTPGRIGGIELKNRIVMAALATGLADAGGFVGEAMLAWFEARARGGAGLVTVGPASCGTAVASAREPAIGDDRFLPGLACLTRRLHDVGAQAAIQLGFRSGDGRDSLAAGAVAPEALDRSRIDACVAAYIEAAHRARSAGFDIVELPANGSGVISQFLNPVSNQRRDAFGGTLENRARVLLDTLRALRGKLPDLPVIVRLGAGLRGGATEAQEIVRVARWAAAIGAAAIHVAAGDDDRSSLATETPAATRAAALLEFAGRVRGQIAAPLIVGGGLADSGLATAALASGKSDFVALGRALIADPNWVGKAATASPARRCLACNGCIAAVAGGAAIHCPVNPWAGREAARPPASPLVGERICVIGAGPAGLAYAAAVAAKNRVTIVERAGAAGGALRLAATAPRFETVGTQPAALSAYIKALEQECRATGADFRYGVDAERDPAALDGFDRIVVATGADYPAVSAAAISNLLQSRAARRWPVSALLSQDPARRWLYPGRRSPTGRRIVSLIPPGVQVEIVGDALVPAGVRAATESAVRAALHPAVRAKAACPPAAPIPSFG
jgi:dimethylglycine catabolism A